MSEERDAHNGDAQDFAHKQSLRASGKCPSGSGVPSAFCTCVQCAAARQPATPPPVAPPA